MYIILLCKFKGFRKNFLDNPADFFLDKIIAVEQGLNVPRQYQASDGMYIPVYCPCSVPTIW